MATTIEEALSSSSSSFLSASTVIALCVFFALLGACIIIGHLLEENRWTNESTTAILLGLVSGVVVLLVSKGASSHILEFNEDLFFLYLLPPIIFNAGFQVKKKQFFKNFTTILLFGVFGTVISFCLISLGAFLLFKRIGVQNLDIKEYLAVGSILSATDSVCTLQVLSQDETPFLYSVVFGEGVVNDATSIVLFNAVNSIDYSKIDGLTALKLLGTFLYLFFTSTALGIAMGLLSAFIIKTLCFGRHSTDREIAIMMIMAYLSYMLAELMSLSGILTVFFCGIVMSHYTWHNVTESSRITTKHTFATISFITETFIFLYVGMDALDIDKWKSSKASPEMSIAVSSTLFALAIHDMNFVRRAMLYMETKSSPEMSIAVSSTLFALVLVGRAAFVFPLANIANCMKKRESEKIKFRQQFIMWWAGLMRGAVTIALFYNEFSKSSEDQDSALMITSTIIVVLFSTMVFGSITKFLIEALLLRHPKQPSDDATDMQSLEDLRLLFLENGDGGDASNQLQAKGSSSLMLLISNPTTTVHYWWRKFDDKCMRPVFGGRGFVPYAPGSPTGAADKTETIS